MKEKTLLVVALFFALNFQVHSLDTGTGADGACTEATLNAGQRTYNCTSLTIGAGGEADFSAVGGAALIIKVQNDVFINGVFNLNGGNGGAGNAGPTTTTGGNGGAGGAKGGDNTCGAPCTGSSGVGTGGGGTGTAGVSQIGGISGGSGGAGGSFGVIGGNGGQGTEDLGGAGTPAAVVASAIYGNANNFETTFFSGSSGGSGGGGDNNGTLYAAGAGGGSGGNLRIIAGGDINVNANITANGGSGGAGNTHSAGGGGGSGGAIWLQSAGQIVIAGGANITATGGSGGAAAGNGGAGGAGGAGLTRLGDSDGSFNNLGNVSPAPTTKTITISSGTSDLGVQNFNSDISCAIRGEENFKLPHLITFLLGFSFIFLLGRMRAN
ncbi:MAG: hypothetical protein GY909_04710 [Oligoflexia bacterium]|nr:hypothetical protein [Oligoflexia bacterium]